MIEAKSTCTSLWAIVKFIPLTQGKFAIVDVADYECLKQWKWCFHKGKTRKTGYAIRNCLENGSSQIRMHRFILGLLEGQFGDHRDGDGLNNRRSNLRYATVAQNTQNRPKQKNNSLGIKGVYFRKDTKKFHAQICVNSKRIHLGDFSTPEEAYSAYCTAAKRLHGEFARLS